MKTLSSTVHGSALLALLVAGAATSSIACSKPEEETANRSWSCTQNAVPSGEVIRCVSQAATSDGPPVGTDSTMTDGTATGGGAGGTADGTATFECEAGSTNPECPPATTSDGSTSGDTTGGAGGDGTTGTGGGGSTTGGGATGTGTSDGTTAGGNTNNGNGGTGGNAGGNGNGNGSSGGSATGAGTSDGTTAGGNTSGNGNGGAGSGSGSQECTYTEDLPYCGGGNGSGSSSTSGGSGSGGSASDGTSSDGSTTGSSSGGSSSGAPGQDRKDSSSSSSGGASSSGGSGKGGGHKYKCDKTKGGKITCTSEPICAPGTHPTPCGACVSDDDGAADCVPPTSGGCWVTGGGFIVAESTTPAAPADGHDNFGGNAKPMKDGTIKGHWNHVDHGTMNHALGRPEYIYCRHVDEPGPGQPGGKKGLTSNQVYFGGKARWRSAGVWAEGYWFDVVAKDHGEPGSVPHAKNGYMVDTYHFTIRKIDDPTKGASGVIVYETRGGLEGGNIQIHAPNNGHPGTQSTLPSWVGLEP